MSITKMISTVCSFSCLYIILQEPTLSRFLPSLYPCIGFISPTGGLSASPAMASRILWIDFLSSFDKNFSASFEYLILIPFIGAFSDYSINIASPKEKNLYFSRTAVL